MDGWCVVGFYLLIIVVDYGFGNIGVFLNMYKWMNIVVMVVCCVGEFVDVECIIFLGVGVFDYVMELFDVFGMCLLFEEKVFE